MASDLKPGRALDALIAEKVMGWSRNRGETNTWFVIAEDGICVYPGGGKLGNGWSPSTDIAASWEVVEKLGGQIGISKDDDQWTCEFNVGATFSVAKTAPHAVCLAALKAVGYGQD